MVENSRVAKRFLRKRKEKEKEDRFYEYCKAQGHLKEACFKLNGYLDWYIKLLKNKKEKKTVKHVNMAKL